MKKFIVLVLIAMVFTALTGCSNKNEQQKSETESLSKDKSDIDSTDILDSVSYHSVADKETIFYDYPETIKIPSMKTINSSLEETAILPSSEAPFPEGGEWHETCYIYPFDDDNRDMAEHNMETYIDLLINSGFSSDEKNFYVKENIGVACGLVYTNTPGGELTVFIFENFDNYKSNDDFLQRNFGENNNDL